MHSYGLFFSSHRFECQSTKAISTNVKVCTLWLKRSSFFLRNRSQKHTSGSTVCWNNIDSQRAQRLRFSIHIVHIVTMTNANGYLIGLDYCFTVNLYVSFEQRKPSRLPSQSQVHDLQKYEKTKKSRIFWIVLRCCGLVVWFQTKNRFVFIRLLLRLLLLLWESPRHRRHSRQFKC